MITTRALVTLLCLLVAVKQAELWGSCPCSCPSRSNNVDCHLYKLSAFPSKLPSGAQNLNLTENAIKDMVLNDAYQDIVLLDLTWNRIENFTNDSLMIVRDRLQYLNLTKNKLEELDWNAFEGFTELIDLRLRGNHLTTLHGNVFSGEHLPNLTYLDLSFNNIETIDDDAFRGLEHLRVLNLEGNQLGSINSKIFQDLHELEELNLAGNVLASVRPNAFQHLDRILSLNLGWNRLTEDQKLMGMATLETLSLRHNDFNKVPTTLLENLHKLRVLHIDNNVLSHLDSTSFKNNERLEELTMSHSKIAKIPVHAFTALKSLKVFRATDCFIAEIEVGAFNPNQQFQEISLRQNYLKRLDYNLLSWDDVSHLDLEENPWDCDCVMAWIVNVTIKEELQETLRCSTPGGIRGQNMLTVFRSQHYNCSATVVDSLPHRRRLVIRVVVISLLIFSATVIVGGFAIICLRNRQKLRNHEQYTYSTIKQSKESVAESVSSSEGQEPPRPERITIGGARKDLGEDV